MVSLCALCVCEGTNAVVPVEVRDNFVKQVLSSHTFPWVLGIRLRSPGMRSKCLDLLSHLTSLYFFMASCLCQAKLVTWTSHTAGKKSPVRYSLPPHVLHGMHFCVCVCACVCSCT